MTDVPKRYFSEYLPVAVADKLQIAFKENGLLEEAVDQILADTKKDMTESLSQLDEDVLVFKSMLIKYKKAYSDILSTHRDAAYTVWEEIDKKMPDTKSMASKLTAHLTEVNREVKESAKLFTELGNSIDYACVHKMKTLIELVDKVTSMPEDSRNLLLKVLEANQVKA